MKMTLIHRCSAAALIATAIAMPAAAVSAASPSTDVAPRMRLVSGIDDTRRVALSGYRHPLLSKLQDLGAASADQVMSGLRLVLKRSPEQEAALHQLLQDQQDPNATEYHHWLTPDQFATRFGPSDSDIQVLGDWLQHSGLHVDEVERGRGAIRFSGTVAQVSALFRVSIHAFRDDGRTRLANIDEPSLPVDAAQVVGGVTGLNQFPLRSMHRLGPKARFDRATGTWQPEATVDAANPQYSYAPASIYALTPTDFAKIYNVAPLWNGGTDGSGIKIAVPGRSDIQLSSVRQYRNAFGLASNDPVVLHPAGLTDPGETEDGDETEAYLDLQIAGGIAKGATLVYVPASSLYDSLSYIVNNNLAPIVAVSYGACESSMGSGGNAYFGGGNGQTGLWQQAAAQGITVVVASGDSGAAGCVDGSGPATKGLGVNGVASTPYNVAVGGTDFNDYGSWSRYWSNTNNAATQASALSYIPEMPWNSSCANPTLLDRLGGYVDLEAVCNTVDTSLSWLLQPFAAGGGISSCAKFSNGSCSGGYAAPAWQALVAGTRSSKARTVPDVALFAATGFSGSSYLICDSTQFNGAACSINAGTFTLAGGTSASAPAFAAIVAMLAQSQISASNPDGRQGLLNPTLYQLAAQQYGSPSQPDSGRTAACNSSSGTAISGSCVFNDITYGSIVVPCKTGSTNCQTARSVDANGLSASGGGSAYTAGAGYDPASGLGSVNAYNLVKAWPSSAATAASTATALSASSMTAVAGSSITLTATVSSSAGVPGGQVTFSDGGTVLGTVALSSGKAQLSTSGLAAGNHPITASYAGTSAYEASSSGVVTVTVATSGNTPLLSFSPNVLDLASVAVGGTTTGTVKLISSGTATVTLQNITANGPFSLQGNCDTTLAPGASCTLTVIYTPASAGSVSGTIDVLSNAQNSSATIAVTANASSTVTASAGADGSGASASAGGGGGSWSPWGLLVLLVFAAARRRLSPQAC